MIHAVLLGAKMSKLGHFEAVSGGYSGITCPSATRPRAFVGLIYLQAVPVSP